MSAGEGRGDPRGARARERARGAPRAGRQRAREPRPLVGTQRGGGGSARRRAPESWVRPLPPHLAAERRTIPDLPQHPRARPELDEMKCVGFMEIVFGLGFLHNFLLRLVVV